MKRTSGMRVVEDCLFYKKWVNADGVVFTQGKRLSASVLSSLTQREREILPVIIKKGKIKAVKELRNNHGFSLREAIEFVLRLTSARKHQDL